MGIGGPPDDPFGGGRLSVQNCTDTASKARAIANGNILLAHHGRYIRQFSEFLAEESESLARKLEKAD